MALAAVYSALNPDCKILICSPTNDVIDDIVKDLSKFTNNVFKIFVLNYIRLSEYSLGAERDVIQKQMNLHCI